jgi:hypothetical protein
MRIRLKEDLIIAGATMVFYLSLGGYLSLYRHYLPYDSLARLVSAWLVFYGTETKLASIGFVWPPIPTLAILPFTIFPWMVESWFAVVAVSAVATALSCVAINHLAALCGFPSGWRWAVVFLFAINPLIIVFGINGMSEALLMLFLLTACYWLVRFWQSDRNTYLIISGSFFGLLPLVRYEFILITLWSGLILVALCWKRRNSFSEFEFREFLEGRLLAYGSLAIYPLFLWAVANWFIMGNPLYFLFNNRSAVSLAEMQLSGYVNLVTSSSYSFRLVFGVWISLFFLGAIGSLTALIIGWRQKSLFLNYLALMFWVVPALQFILLIQRANVPLLRYFVMSIPLGFVIALVAAYRLLPIVSNDRRGKMLFFGVFIFLTIASNVVSWMTLERYPYQDIERESWRGITTKEPLDNRNFDQAYQIGQLLPNIIPAGSRVLIDTYQFGFGIMLGAKDHALFLDFTDPNYEEALKNPPAYVDYLILPRPEQRGALYAINIAQKKLYSEGASWAEWLDVLPTTDLGWKLYKVKRNE